MRVLRINKQLFWDVDYEKLDFEESSVLIIGRVFNYGRFDDIREVLDGYGVDRVKEDIVKDTDLTAKTLNFVSKYFDIPLKNFRCYIRRQSNPVPWKY